MVILELFNFVLLREYEGFVKKERVCQFSVESVQFSIRAMAGVWVVFRE